MPARTLSTTSYVPGDGIRIQGVMQPRLPPIERLLPHLCRHVSFVGNVVGDTRKGVDCCDVRPHGFGQQTGSEGKVFVMRPRERLTRPVCARQRLNAVGHSGILAVLTDPDLTTPTSLDA